VHRKTIARKIEAVGLGVRSGTDIRVAFLPAAPGTGLQVVRTDLGCSAVIGLDNVLPMPVCTSIRVGDSQVAFVEHLMAALHAQAITDIFVEVSGAELPMFDGSALPYWHILQEAGEREYEDEVEPFVIAGTIEVGDGSKCLRTESAAGAAFSYSLSHPHPLAGEQSASYEPGCDDFGADLAPARTWATFEELSALQAAGMLAGGSEENAVVIYPDRLSEALRWPNAFARHKLLDLYGDLYLLGAPVIGRFAACRTGHADNHALARLIAGQRR